MGFKNKNIEKFSESNTIEHIGFGYPRGNRRGRGTGAGTANPCAKHEAGIIVCFLFTIIFLSSYRLSWPFSCSCVSFGSLASHGKSFSMSNTSICAKIHKSFNISTYLSS